MGAFIGAVFGWWLIVAFFTSFYFWAKKTNRSQAPIERRFMAAAYGLAWPYFAFVAIKSRVDQGSTRAAGPGQQPGWANGVPGSQPAGNGAGPAGNGPGQASYGPGAAAYGGAPNGYGADQPAYGAGQAGSGAPPAGYHAGPAAPGASGTDTPGWAAPGETSGAAGWPAQNPINQAANWAAGDETDR